jgi:predicted Na+-dependent transporter
MIFCVGLRNISAALVLAIQYFEPRTAIPVVIGILFQQSISAISGRLFFGQKSDQKVNNKKLNGGRNYPSVKKDEERDTSPE